MEPMFENKTDFTYELYMKACLGVQKKALLIKNTALIILTLAVAYLCIINGWYVIAAAYIVVVGWDLFRYKRTVKKNYNSYKSAADKTITYKFYEDRYTDITENSEKTTRYNEIYKMKETKDCFCIYLSRNLLNIIDKKTCSSELADFLRELEKKVKANGK
ncbi:MAG: YcxB family protein [Clostridiales bacterium]|nr:YcxB family protein [Clostridiales bacterium]